MAPPRAERSGPRRLAAAWRGLAREQQLVAVTAAVLLLTMLLPWYSLDGIVRGQTQPVSDGKAAITVFSFVEAAIFLVALGVTLLVLARGDRRAFHLPGGDGTVVTAAGAWATFLIFFRFLDKPDGESGATGSLVYNLSWGIFFGLLAALALAAAGLRLRAAQIAEPALPGDVVPGGGPAVARPSRPQRDPAEDRTRQERDQAPDATRQQRRQEREARRRADAGTPVRERKPAPSEAPTTIAPSGEEPTTFEPPEFRLPPPRPRRD